MALDGEKICGFIIFFIIYCCKCDQALFILVYAILLIIMGLV